MNWTEDELEAKLKDNPDLRSYSGTDSPPLIVPHKLVSPKKNKYRAQRTCSELCRRTFDSKAEAKRGEELALLEKAGAISDLRYQIPFVLSVSPKVSITIDFTYLTQGKRTFEDVKGVLTRDSRTKLAWLKEKYGVDVRLIR